LQQVQLQFLRFRLEGSSNCEYDKLNIYDGSDDTAPLIRSFCGSRRPGDIAASGNVVFVSFLSDGTITDYGFTIQYKIAVRGCSGRPAVLGGSGGTFGIDAAQYVNNMRCDWKIQVEPTQIIKLDFLSFNVERRFGCTNDRVSVYDGPARWAPSLGTFCGSILPGDVISANNSLYVSFTSDSSVQKNGFKIQYTALDPDVPPCHGTPAELSGASGEFWISRSQYRANMHCQWLITVEDGKRVHLHFERFDLESSINCSHDSLLINDGFTGERLQTVCGSRRPSDVTSYNRSLLVVFKTNNISSESGFVVTYTARKVIRVPDECGLPAITPQFPRIVGGIEAKEHSWPWQISLVLQGEGHNCGGSIVHKEWIITAAHCVERYTASQLRVLVGEHDRSGTFEFDLEVSSVCLPDSDIAAGTDCVTTGWGDTRGTGDNTVLHQVNLPIVDAATCRSSHTRSITDAMLCAGLQEGGKDSCQGDSGGPLVCRSGNGPWTLYGVTSWGDGCGKRGKPGIYARVSKFLPWIEQTINGTSPTVVDACNGETAVLTGSAGEFGTVGGQYNNDETCRWRVQVEVGKRVQLHFIRFDIEGYSSSCYDKVKIYDGNSTAAPLISSLCGGSLPEDIITSGNTVFVYFDSDGSITKTGFRIQYSATEATSSRTTTTTTLYQTTIYMMTSTTPMMTTPRYTTTPHEHVTAIPGCSGSPASLSGSDGTFGINKTYYLNDMRCAWKILVNPTQIIRLEFLRFDVESSSTCDYDSVTVYDGMDYTAPLLGTFCGSTLPGNIISSQSSLFVSFKSDSSKTMDGFMIKYIAVDSATFNGTTQTTSTTTPWVSTTTRGPNVTFPGCNGNSAVVGGLQGTFGINKTHYRRHMRCAWKIQVEPPMVIQLEFLSFAVGLFTDSVSVYDGGNSTALMLGTFTGFIIPNNVISTNNSLFVSFHSDSSQKLDGFEIKYRAVQIEPDIDNCLSNPCQNGGTCSAPRVAFFSCDCVAGYTGYTCESDIDECASNPCHNGARCSTSQVDMFSCDCLAGYSGHNCEMDLDTCRSHPCQNAATCRSLIDAFQCACVAGFTGDVCEKESKESSSIFIIAGAAGGGVLIGVVIGIIVSMIYRCRRQQLIQEELMGVNISAFDDNLMSPVQTSASPPRQ
ncbi:Cubilin, partial [Lamellibrachia satsuma]